MAKVQRQGCSLPRLESGKVLTRKQGSRSRPGIILVNEKMF